MNQEHHHGTLHQKHQQMQGEHYRKLMIMAVLSFMAMYIIMYAMVNSFSNVFLNVNQFYMAGLMAMLMAIIELVVMGSMYLNKKRNALIIGISAVLMVVFFLGIRKQAGVSDRQFLKSMIPHHAGAILMCEEAGITDPEIKELCKTIRSSQQQEIKQMKAKLEQLKK